MTRERLQSVPLEKLVSLARSEGIELSDSIERPELIDLILENYEEIRREREQENNLSVRVEETKFGIAEEEAPAGSGADPYPIPGRYNETRIVLMVRDPHWAFTYWDIDDQKALRIKKDPNFEQLVLRVHDLQPTSSFDIPIQWNDSSWYIYLPSEDCSYLLELGYISAGKFRLLGKSDEIRTPRESFSEAQQGHGAALELFLPAAALDRPSSRLSSEAIPQRILSALKD